MRVVVTMDDAVLAYATRGSPLQFGDDMDMLTRQSPAAVFDREDIDRDTIGMVLDVDGHKDDLFLHSAIAPELVSRGHYDKAMVRASVPEAEDLEELARARKDYLRGEADAAIAGDYLGRVGDMIGRTVTTTMDDRPDWMAPGYAAKFVDMTAADRRAALRRDILPTAEDSLEAADSMAQAAFAVEEDDAAMVAALAEQEKLKAEWEAYQASQVRQRRRRGTKKRKVAGKVRTIRTGKNGGLYYMRGGRRVYVK